MRNTYTEYYRLTSDQYKYLWENCFIILDTNILLHLYDHTEDVRNRMLEALNKVSDKLWIPYHVGYEYHKNRLSTIEKKKSRYTKLKNSVSKPIKTLNHDFEKIKNEYKNSNHPSLNINKVFERLDSLESSLNESLKEVIKVIDENEKQYPDAINNDVILEKCTSLFEGKVGKPYNESQLEKIVKDGEKRYNKKIPPGYKDATKEENAYGDLIIWHQILDKVREEKKSVIFVTDDCKDDWWECDSNKNKQGPRISLIKEVKEIDNSLMFHMYSEKSFYELVQNHYPEVIDESVVRDIVEQAKYSEENEEKRIKYYIDNNKAKARKIIAELLDLDPDDGKVNEYLQLYLDKYYNGFTYNCNYTLEANSSYSDAIIANTIKRAPKVDKLLLETYKYNTEKEYYDLDEEDYMSYLIDEYANRD